MKNICLCFASIIGLQLFAAAQSQAQNTTAVPSVLKAPPAAISIDGNLKDWNDSLQYLNAENSIRYTVANDKENLYFAFRIDDPYEKECILKAGITVSVDPKGKKKNAYSITFPLNVQTGNLPVVKQDDILNGVTQADRDELLRETMTTLRGIKVEGFKDIEGDMITTSNTYGIKTAINYDEKGNLVCEAAIALKLFHLDDRSKAQWLYAIKINNLNNRPNKNKETGNNAGGMGGRRGMGGGRGGMGGGRGGMAGRSGSASSVNEGDTSAKTVDFSGKFYLAAAQ